MRRIQPGNFDYKFALQRVHEILMLIYGRNEGTGPGNHLFFKIICNIDTDRGPKRALPLGLDRQAIDGDQRGFGAAAGLGQEEPEFCGPSPDRSITWRMPW